MVKKDTNKTQDRKKILYLYLFNTFVVICVINKTSESNKNNSNNKKFDEHCHHVKCGIYIIIVCRIQWNVMKSFKMLITFIHFPFDCSILIFFYCLIAL